MCDVWLQSQALSPAPLWQKREDKKGEEGEKESRDT